MGRLRQSKKKQPPQIEQIKFVETVTERFKKAEAPSTQLEDSLAAAREVSKDISAIAAGSLVINPPLSHDQYVGFRDKANIIISIGEKATSSLAVMAQEHTQASSEPAFAGQGSAAKS